MTAKSPIILSTIRKLVQIGERMKVATVSVAGERGVGQVTPDGMSIAPFDLAIAEARDGSLALIPLNGLALPPTLSSIRLSQVSVETPIPLPRRDNFCVDKSQDTFCSMGPVAVAPDEFDIDDTPISCYVDGELRQSSNTRLLTFDLPTIIETLSTGITLQPGDVIATGTLAGVGIVFGPPRYLKCGDAVRIEVGGIVLENEIVERSP